MASRRKGGLGRGLDALIPQKAPKKQNLEEINPDEKGHVTETFFGGEEDIEKIGEFINIVQNENPNGIGAECLYTDVLERFLDGKQTKQKPVEWSDENKKIIDDIIEYLGYFNDFDCGDEPYEEYYERFEKYIKFMESLKPQSNWKPSEEHIRYLQAVVNDVHNIGSESCSIALSNLLEQLKKL